MAPTIDSILKKPTPQKVLILIVLLCVIGGLLYYFICFPIQREQGYLESEKNQLAKEKYEYQMITRDLKKYQEEVVKLDEELLMALTQIPNDKEIPEILKNISTLGKEANLEFTLFRPKAEQTEDFLAKVPFELVVIGGYHNVGLFFDRVSKLPRIINVADFNMTRAKDVKSRNESEILVKTTCLLYTYRWIEKSKDTKSKK